MTDAPKPYTYAYQFHDCVRFSDREVNGARPISSFPLYDQKAIDKLQSEIAQLREDLHSCTESWHRVMRNKLAADDRLRASVGKLP